MTEIEKIEEKVRIAQEAMEHVVRLANLDRKVAHGKHVDSHYSQAIDHLNRQVEHNKAMLVRVKAIGR